METVILLYPAAWLQLPIEVRQRLAEDFHMKRSGGNSVTTDNGRTRVDSDGHNTDDLRKISRESMLEYLGMPADSKDGFWPLWDQVVAKAAGSQEQPTEPMFAGRTDPPELPPSAPGVNVPDDGKVRTKVRAKKQ